MNARVTIRMNRQYYEIIVLYVKKMSDPYVSVRFIVITGKTRQTRVLLACR